MEVIDRNVRAKVKTMKKRFRTLIPAKKGPLNHEDFSQMAAMVDAFRNELQGLSDVLNNALALAPPQETTGPVSSRPRVISTSQNVSDSGNESSSEMSFPSTPSSPTMINEGFIAHLARLQASRASRRIKREELRLSLEKSLIVQEEIKKRFAETKARRDSVGQ